MKERIKITWMHCISCEILLEKELKQIKWVQLLMISHKEWLMEINYDKKEDLNKVIKIIEKNWFKIIKETENNIDENTDKVTNILFNFIAILIVIILIIFSQLFDIYKYTPSSNSLNYSWAFLIGIIASISTCLAITWWIIIAFSRNIKEKNGKTWIIKTQLWFQIWRILGFFLLWGLLWLTGQIINFSFSLTGILTFIMWILFLYIWLNIMWLLPSLTRFWIYMPKSLVPKIEKLSNTKYAPIVWALTFFLPCWFTQTVQLIAISSGSFMAWWLIMLFFALWTFPVLFSVWLGASYFSGKKFPLLNKIIAAILIFFWISTMYNSYNLLSFYSPSNTNQESTVDLPVEIVRVGHNWAYTIPREIILEKWKNYQVIITPEINGMWCMWTQVIPKIKSKISYVRAGEDIVYDFNNRPAWKYPIVCASMWMVQWTIIVK